MKKPCILLGAALLLFLQFFHSGKSAWSAEFKQFGSWIVITGTIENGDFEKFANLIERNMARAKEQRTDITAVALYSRGGAAIEATKIGRAIRKLRLRTTGPTSEIGNRSLVYCPPGLGGSSNQSFYNPDTGEGSKQCACESACALIWSAGILRNGRVGFHRPHFAKVTIDKVDVLETNERQAWQIVEQYMTDMDLPESVMVSTATTGPDSLHYIDARQELSRTPTFKNLSNSECSVLGDFSQVEAELKQFENITKSSKADTNRLSEVLAVYGEFAACHVKTQEQLAFAARDHLDSVIEAARQDAGHSKKPVSEIIHQFLLSPVTQQSN